MVVVVVVVVVAVVKAAAAVTVEAIGAAIVVDAETAVAT